MTTIRKRCNDLGLENQEINATGVPELNATPKTAPNHDGYPGSIIDNKECPLCHNQIESRRVSGGNLGFLQERDRGGNLDEAISLARICWINSSALGVSANAKAMIESFAENTRKAVVGEVKEILLPLKTTMSGLRTIFDALEKVEEKLPEKLKPHFTTEFSKLQDKFNALEATMKTGTMSIQQLNERISELIYRPAIKGKVSETSFELNWSDAFPRDDVQRLGGAGREDLLVRPYMETGKGSGTWIKGISVERKSGKQKHSSAHQTEAVRHAKDIGCNYAILVYDQPENLAETAKPLRIDQLDGVILAVVDIQSGSWKVAKQLFEILQSRENSSNGDIDIGRLQKTIDDWATVQCSVEKIRRDATTCYNASDRMLRINLAALEEAIEHYRQRLKSFLNEGSGKLEGYQKQPGLTGIQTSMTVTPHDIGS